MFGGKVSTVTANHVFSGCVGFFVLAMYHPPFKIAKNKIAPYTM
jgi:hypothetical protein